MNMTKKLRFKILSVFMMYYFVLKVIICTVFNENVSWKVIKFNLYMKALNRKNYIFYQLTAHRSYPISWGKCFTFTDRSSRQ